MTEFELFQALRPHYPPQQFALLPQVGSSTGIVGRHCDGLALGLWPSRGLHLHGFEIKSYRGDWMRELGNPEKAEEIAQYCNYWWIVAAHPGIVADGELPKGWGLYIYDPKKLELQQKVKAPFRKKTTKIDIMFMAAILRKAQDCVTPTTALALAAEDGFKKGLEQGKLKAKHATEELARLQQTVNTFHRQSGVDISSGWDRGESIGRAVNKVMQGQASRFGEALIRTAEKILAELKPEKEQDDDLSATGILPSGGDVAQLPVGSGEPGNAR